MGRRHHHDDPRQADRSDADAGWGRCPWALVLQLPDVLLDLEGRLAGVTVESAGAIRY